MLQATDLSAVAQIPRGGLPSLTELLTAGAPRLALSLIAVGGLVWLVTYLLVIRIGFREKTYAIPAVAVCLNLTWELTHSLVFRPPRPVDFYTNLAWLGLDLVILYQVVRFGRRMQAVAAVRNHWPVILVVTLVVALAGHVTFHQHLMGNSIFPDASGAIAANIINLVMSVLFLAMYFSRPDGTGISRGVAWGKFLGTGLYSAGNVMVLSGIEPVSFEVQVRAAGAAHWVNAGTIGSATIEPGFMYFLFAALALTDLLYLYLVYRPRPAA